MTSVADKPKRRRLDHERVVVAAEAVVDRDGWQDLTMTALAAELGVKVPSLYNHVPNLDALRGELQIRTMAALGAELQRAVMGKSEAKGFVALADVFALRPPVSEPLRRGDPDPRRSRRLLHGEPRFERSGRRGRRVLRHPDRRDPRPPAHCLQHPARCGGAREFGLLPR